MKVELRKTGHPAESRAKQARDLDLYRAALMIAVKTLRVYADEKVYGDSQPDKRARDALNVLAHQYGDLEI